MTTNIVCAASAHLPRGILDRLAADGVLAGTIDTETVRFVTHADVDDDGIERALGALARIAADRGPHARGRPDTRAGPGTLG